MQQMFSRIEIFCGMDMYPGSYPVRQVLSEPVVSRRAFEYVRGSWLSSNLFEQGFQPQQQTDIALGFILPVHEGLLAVSLTPGNCQPDIGRCFDNNTGINRRTVMKAVDASGNLQIGQTLNGKAMCF